MRAEFDLDRPKPRSRREVWVLLTWTGLALVQAMVLWTQAYVPFFEAVLYSLFDFYVLGAISVVVWRRSARWSATNWTTPRLLLCHAALMLSSVAVWKGLTVGYLFLAVGPGFWTHTELDRSWAWQLLGAFSTYSVMLGLTFAVQAHDREHERERRAADLELAAREAQLMALKAQIQPHFLFNALNSILALINTDPERASDMVSRLSVLLRSVFEQMDCRVVPLSQEIELIEVYLGIEQIRFGDRLRVSMQIDPAARSVPVPPFILQPIVENAIKHGIAPNSRQGEVRVSAELRHSELVLRVRDTGGGQLPGKTERHGRGLALTEERLKAMYGEGHDVSSQRVDGRLSVELNIPVLSDVH